MFREVSLRKVLLRVGGALRRSEGRHARQRDQSQSCCVQLRKLCTAQGAADLCIYTSSVQQGAVTGLKNMQKPRGWSLLCCRKSKVGWHGWNQASRGRGGQTGGWGLDPLALKG